MSHPYDILDVPGSAGQLIFTPCPGSKGTSVDEALATLQAAGADALITLMPAEELARNEATQLAQLCAERGLEWFHLPVADEQMPLADLDQAWEQSADRINELLDAGSGRTGLIAARILMDRDVPRATAIASVQALRPKAIQHPAHVGWIERFGA